MSRATWFRRGKPTEKHEPINALPPFNQAMMHGLHVSRRTAERITRVLHADPVLARCVIDKRGGWKAGRAEELIKDAEAHRRWRERSGLPWPVPKLDED